MNALKTSLTLVGGISEANVSHPLSFALAKDNREIKIEKTPFGRF